MNLTLNSAMNKGLHATGAAPVSAPASAPAAASTAAPDVQALPDGAALPFGHWIALDAGLPGIALPDGALPGFAAGAPDEMTLPLAAETAESADAVEPAVLPDLLLAAMAPQWMPAALPAMMLAMPGMKPASVDDATSAPVADTALVPAPGAGTSAAAPVSAPAQPLLAQAPSAAPAVLPTAMPAARPEPATSPVAPAAVETGTADAGVDAAPLAPGAGSNVNSGVTQGAGARSADSIVLAGPPTAWRQSLHEALGERLQLQLGRNIEQATIRLDPPLLGRIDIAIRHSGGNLEVHIAASNTEVLRQLNTVSDSLRADLAGRQYSSVSVNVSEVPRAQASAQTGAHTPGQPGGQHGADAQGRGRQEQPRAPGLALNDAGEAGSLFSMN